MNLTIHNNGTIHIYQNEPDDPPTEYDDDDDDSPTELPNLDRLADDIRFSLGELRQLLRRDLTANGTV